MCTGKNKTKFGLTQTKKLGMKHGTLKLFEYVAHIQWIHRIKLRDFNLVYIK